MDEGSCGTRLVMKKVRDAIADIVDHTTLRDVEEQIAKARRQAPTVAYSI